MTLYEGKVEAENPEEYSKSYRCLDHKPKYEAQAVKNPKIAASMLN